MTDWSKVKHDKTFMERQSGSAFWEAYVASRIALEGFAVTINPSNQGEHVDPSRFDSHDLDIHVHPDATLPVEVKSRNIKFYDHLDAEKTWVCSQFFFLNNWPGKDALGRDFLIVSKQTSCILWVPAGTKVELGRERVDRSRGSVFKVAEVKTADILPFAEFVRFLKGHG